MAREEIGVWGEAGSSQHGSRAVGVYYPLYRRERAASCRLRLINKTSFFMYNSIRAVFAQRFLVLCVRAYAVLCQRIGSGLLDPQQLSPNLRCYAKKVGDPHSVVLLFVRIHLTHERLNAIPLKTLQVAFAHSALKHPQFEKTAQKMLFAMFDAAYVTRLCTTSKCGHSAAASAAQARP